MKLHELLAIMNWHYGPSYSVSVQKDDGSGNIADHFYVNCGTDPEHTGQIYSKSQREDIKNNRAKLKAYRDYEVYRCFVGSTGSLDIYVGKPET